MNTGKTGGTTINVVAAVPQVEVKDVNGNDLYQSGKFISCIEMLGDGAGCAVQHALQVVILTFVLDFNDDDLTGAVFHLQVDPIIFIDEALLVTFAFQ